MTLKVYYPPPSMVAGYGISNTLNFFDAGGRNMLLLSTGTASSGGTPAGILDTGSGGDMNIVAQNGYIWLAPSGRKIVFNSGLGLSPANGDMPSFCVWKSLAKAAGAAAVFCPASQPTAIALADINKHITYDTGDIGDSSGYLLCCAAGIVEPFTASVALPQPPSPSPPGSVPPKLPCYPPAPDIDISKTCPAGQKGYITKMRFYTCPGPKAGVWTVMADSCITAPPCVLPRDEVQELNCPYPQTGSITQIRTWHCQGSTPVADPWVTTSTTCKKTCLNAGEPYYLGQECCSGFDYSSNNCAYCG